MVPARSLPKRASPASARSRGFITRRATSPLKLANSTGVNLLRVISRVDAIPVPIIPAAGRDRQPLDLSLSILRSVSPIHIEYLKNMGVGASMSISIIVDDALWGLFACHHYSPLCPSFERRSVCELFAQMFSMRLESRERKELIEFERRARDISDQLLGAVASDETLLKDPDWLGDISRTQSRRTASAFGSTATPLSPA